MRRRYTILAVLFALALLGAYLVWTYLGVAAARKSTLTFGQVTQLNEALLSVPIPENAQLVSADAGYDYLRYEYELPGVDTALKLRAAVDAIAAQAPQTGWKAVDRNDVGVYTLYKGNLQVSLRWAAEKLMRVVVAFNP